MTYQMNDHQVDFSVALENHNTKSQKKEKQYACSAVKGDKFNGDSILNVIKRKMKEFNGQRTPLDFNFLQAQQQINFT